MPSLRTLWNLVGHPQQVAECLAALAGRCAKPVGKGREGVGQCARGACQLEREGAGKDRWEAVP